MVEGLTRGERVYANPLLHRLVPDRVAVAAAKLVGLYQWRYDEELREESRRRMGALLAGTPREGEVDAIAKQHLVEARVRGLVFWRSGIPELEGAEHLLRAAAEGRGVLVATTHIGANAMSHTRPISRLGRRTYTIGGDWLFPPYRGYDGLRGLRLKERLERDGNVWVLGDGFAKLWDALRRGEVCTIMYDVPGTHRTTVLGRPAWLRSGIARLAVDTGAAVLPMFVGREGHRMWARIEPPLEVAGVDELMDLLADRLSQEILARPAEREGSWFLDSLWDERTRPTTLAAPGA